MTRMARCHSDRPDRAGGLCNACYKKHRLSNPHARERVRAQQRAWYWDNHEKSLRSLRRNSLKRKYGITEADYQNILNYQSGVCAICGVHGKRLNVDHDHATGAVRGLLCHGCNTTVAHLEVHSPRCWRYIGGENYHGGKLA